MTPHEVIINVLAIAGMFYTFLISFNLMSETGLFRKKIEINIVIEYNDGHRTTVPNTYQKNILMSLNKGDIICLRHSEHEFRIEAKYFNQNTRTLNIYVRPFSEIRKQETL